MNRIATLALFLAAAVTMAGSAAAKASVTGVNVPFNFAVNDTFLPAGHYTIGSDSKHPEILIVRDEKNNVRALEVGMNGSGDTKNSGKLVFHKVAGQYFLREVHLASNSADLLLSQSKMEKKASKLGAERLIETIDLN
jgi:hypothetical protein